MRTAIIVLGAAAAMLLAYAVLLTWTKEEEDDSAAQRAASYSRGREEQEKKAWQKYARSFLEILQLVLDDIQFLRMDKMKSMLHMAGIPLLPAEFISLAIGLAIGGGILIGGIFWSQAMGIAGGISIGAVLGLLIGFRIRKRQKQFSDQLGGMLLLMSNGLRAGFSFLQAVELIVTDMKPPISQEFRQLLQEIRLGVPAEEALDRMDKRIQNKDLHIILTAIQIQRQVGGNLAQIFDTIALTIQDRIRLEAEVKALTAQGKLSAIVLGVLPVFLAVAMTAIAPDFMAPLYHTTMGKIGIAAGILLDCIGTIIIYRITNIRI